MQYITTDFGLKVAVLPPPSQVHEVDAAIQDILRGDDRDEFNTLCDGVDWSDGDAYALSMLPLCELLVELYTGRRKAFIHRIIRRTPAYHPVWDEECYVGGGTFGDEVVREAVTRKKRDRSNLRFIAENTPGLHDLFRNAPEEQQAFRQWFCWKYRVRNGKRLHIAYSPHTGERASASDPATWGTFDETVTAMETGGYDGIGYVLGAPEGRVGLPADAQTRPQWICYRLEMRHGKLTKVPYNAVTGEPAEYGVGLDMLGTYEQALATAETHGFDGVGFVVVDERTRASIDQPHRIVAG